MTSKDSVNSFGARDTLEVAALSYQIYRLDAVPNTEKLPYSLKVLAENLLRNEDGATSPRTTSRPSRTGIPRRNPALRSSTRRRACVMQDFTGVPCVVDLATMREAIGDLGGDPEQGQPAGAGRAGDRPLGDRRRVRHRRRLRAQRRDRVPAQRRALPVPALGAGRLRRTSGGAAGHRASCHQVNIEYLARVVFDRERRRPGLPGHLVGTDSHTTMVNGLGVLGWGVGGIEAEAAMLGQPVSMLIPQVVGFKLTGEMPRGRHGHRRGADRHRDAAQARRGRQVRRVLRRGRGRGAARQPRHHRQHEPRIRLHLRDLPDRRRDHRVPAASPAAPTSSWRWSRPTPKSRACGTTPSTEPAFSEYLELDLSEVVPSIAGPKRPQDRIALSEAKSTFRKTIPSYVGDDPDKHEYSKLDEELDETFPASDPGQVANGHADDRAPVQSAAAHSKGRVSNPVPVKSERVRRLRARPRRGGDRRDHVVHQHLQPRGDAAARRCWRATPSSRDWPPSRG